MKHTFTSFIRDDEGLRECGCQDWQFVLSPPNNTPSEHETAFGLFPPASTLAIWHATALMLSQMPDGKGVSLSFHGLLADSCSSKAKSVASFTDKGLLPCGFTTWQLRGRGKSYLFIIWIIYEIPNVF